MRSERCIKPRRISTFLFCRIHHRIREIRQSRSKQFSPRTRPHPRDSARGNRSIHLARDGGDASLWFQPGAKVEMEPGDGAVYLGYETVHWRERFTGNTMGQMFLHYVVADGPLAALYFDGHPQRFPPSISEGLT